MADALDSKSGSLVECGFKSHLRYQSCFTGSSEYIRVAFLIYVATLFEGMSEPVYC